MGKAENNDAISRENFILEHLEKNEYVNVAFLSKALSVSEMTIRRDLEKLEKKEKLLRVYGGARSIKRETHEEPISKRLVANAEEKNAIGRYCASLVEDGDVIALDASTTAFALAKHLKARVTVVTNNIFVAHGLSSKENVEIVLLGGTVRKASCSTVGLDMAQMMSKYFVGKLFLSSKAIDMEFGATDATPYEGEAKKAMISSSSEIYLMMDSSKLGKRAFYQVCKIDKIHKIITNQASEYNEAQKEFIEQCEQNNIDLYFAKHEIQDERC
ncbi:MAG TPA: DeoR/GlpR family DNA-binding transcription regulator [Clostridia bacterium]|nr:DeoR/GlpR family DNA-binding transcription regulator [Clostridia bacterium]